MYFTHVDLKGQLCKYKIYKYFIFKLIYFFILEHNRNIYIYTGVKGSIEAPTGHIEEDMKTAAFF